MTTAIALDADFVFKILCFILVVIIIRLVFLLFSSLFSKHNDGIIGFLMGLGLIAGAIKVALIFILLALLFPS